MKKRGSREDTEQWLWEEFNKIKNKGEPIGPTAFAERVGIHRTYLYDFPVLAAEIAAYGKVTQPEKSRRGAGVSAAAAKKREIDAKVRREHTRWSIEIEELRQRLKDAEDSVTTLMQDKRMLSDKYERLKRLYEYLLMLAVEAGVSPSEVERVQEQILIIGIQDSSTLKEA